MLRTILARVQEVHQALPLPTDVKAKHRVALSGQELLVVQQLCASVLISQGFDLDYNPTRDGLLLESIIDKISEK